MCVREVRTVEPLDGQMAQRAGILKLVSLLQGIWNNRRPKRPDQGLTKCKPAPLQPWSLCQLSLNHWPWSLWRLSFFPMLLPEGLSTIPIRLVSFSWFQIGKAFRLWWHWTLPNYSIFQCITVVYRGRKIIGFFIETIPHWQNWKCICTQGYSSLAGNIFSPKCNKLLKPHQNTEGMTSVHAFINNEHCTLDSFTIKSSQLVLPLYSS